MDVGGWASAGCSASREVVRWARASFCLLLCRAPRLCAHGHGLEHRSLRYVLLLEGSASSVGPLAPLLAEARHLGR